MKNSVNQLRLSLESALELIDDSQLLSSNDLKKINQNKDSLLQHLDFSDASSLMERCDNVDKKYANEKPILRIIHHLACSGGSLVSKFLSAMPNVNLLSEIHPFTELHLNRDKPHYAPTDIISLIKYANVAAEKTIIEEIFLNTIVKLNNHLESNGCYLVLRDHTHSDFCTNICSMDKTLINILSGSFEIKSVLTIRDPIDSYLSLVKNNWLHFTPASFEEYCFRIIKMLEQYEDCPVIKYEKIVDDPLTQLQKITDVLCLPFCEDFTIMFNAFRVTGDSGRASGTIASKPRRKYEDEFKNEIQNSHSYQIIKTKFGY